MKNNDEHLKWKKARFSDQVIGKWSEKLEMDPSEVGTNSHLSETSLNLNHLNIWYHIIYNIILWIHLRWEPTHIWVKVVLKERNKWERLQRQEHVDILWWVTASGPFVIKYLIPKPWRKKQLDVFAHWQITHWAVRLKMIYCRRFPSYLSITEWFLESSIIYHK